MSPPPSKDNLLPATPAPRVQPSAPIRRESAFSLLLGLILGFIALAMSAKRPEPPQGGPRAPNMSRETPRTPPRSGGIA